MSGLDYFLLIGDFTVATTLVIGFYFAYRNNRISLEYYTLFWVGCFIRSIWEFTFLFLGPEFLHSIKEWPYGLGGWPRKLSHSIWDGVILMVGIYFGERFLPDPLFRSFNKKEAGIIRSILGNITGITGRIPF